MSEVQRTISAWAIREILPWSGKNLDRAETYARFHELNASHADIRLFHIHDGTVDIFPKISDDITPVDDMYDRRATLYRILFQNCTDILDSSYESIICMSMRDELFNDEFFPIFCFQKKISDIGILIPDIDFLILNFYENGNFTDNCSYFEKTDKAIFVGATTGYIPSTRTASPLTVEMVKTRAIPRLDAGAFFYGDPDVKFLLPSIVQFESDDAQRLLEELPFCGGNKIDWTEQFRHKFIISIDGNGATCSRVVISLASNSVLLKYDSDFRLYYCDGLVAWENYIPISDHRQISNIVNIEKLNPGLFYNISEKSREFVEKYLNKSSVLDYTSNILTLYDSCFKSPKIDTKFDTNGNSVFTLDFFVTVHIQDRGDETFRSDQWAGALGSGKFVEAIKIDYAGHAGDLSLAYCVEWPGGEASDWANIGDVCGTRGRSLPIVGFRIRPQGAGATEMSLSYAATFIDGSMSEFVESDKRCASKSGTPVEAIRVAMSVLGQP